MSIRTIQISSVLDEVTNSFFASGVNPTVNQILNQMGMYFSLYPAGNPLRIPSNLVASNMVVKADDLNIIFAHIAMNIELLYQSTIEQTAQNVNLTQTLASSLSRLSMRQQSLSKKIDDCMLANYNSGSYYLSVSDNFGDTSQTDLSLTSAFVDTLGNDVVIPTISSLSSILNPNKMGLPSIKASIDGSSATYKTTSPISFSTNGLSNTLWETQVHTKVPSEVILEVEIPIVGGVTALISQINITPHGVSPVQAYVQVGIANSANGTSDWYNFGGDIQTSSGLMKFIAGQLANVNSIRLFFRKTVPDYTNVNNGTTDYVYVFGASNLVMMENVYDNQATFITSSLSIPQELKSTLVIDAVSLAVDSVLPGSTNIDYFVALDPGNVTQISDLDWQLITPIDKQSGNPDSVVQFNGAFAHTVYINSKPTSNDLQLIPIDTNSANLALQNPTSTIIPSVDVYSIANFGGTPLLNSILLEEGINATKIHYVNYGDLKNYSTNGINEDTATSHDADIEAWGNIINKESNTTTAKVLYGEIDSGDTFFYGGDIGENGVSIFVETYLHLDESIEPIVDYLRKADAASQTWDVRAYLNGEFVGWLPGRNSQQSDVPIDQLMVSWNFNKGPNHIVLLINIPPLSTITGSISPYNGSLQLMQTHRLYQFGTVKLADWNYIDFFDLQYNTVGTPTTFTILNGQLISRRQPTVNFRLKYNEASGQGAESIRFRADLSRSYDNSHVTPQLKSYQLRFLYGNNN